MTRKWRKSSNRKVKDQNKEKKQLEEMDCIERKNQKNISLKITDTLRDKILYP